MKVAFALILAAASTAASADAEVTFALPSGVSIKIVEASFDRKFFKISGCTADAAVCRINGHTPMGSVAKLPKTYVKSISVSYQGQSHSLNASDMYDAWGKRPLEVKGAVRYFGGNCFDAKNCQFRGLFSDGASSFVAEWQIVDGLATRTVLSGSDDIVHLFMHDIDPPVFE